MRPLASPLLLLALLGVAFAGSAARAQSPLTERTGVSVLVSEFNEGGSFGTLAQTEELGGLDSPDHHRFGIDVTVLSRFSSGLALGVRGGAYRYDPVGLGARAGLVAGLSAGLWRGATARAEVEAAYLRGRFDASGTEYSAAALEGDVTLLLQQRVPLVGSVDLRPAAGPYVVVRNTHEAWDVDSGASDNGFEVFEVQGGVEVGAALSFELLDARIALAPVTRFALGETGALASFSAVPGGGVWVDF